MFAYGNFITILIQLYHSRVHHLFDGKADEQAEEAGAPCADCSTFEDVVLLREIRDALKAR